MGNAHRYRVWMFFDGPVKTKTHYFAPSDPAQSPVLLKDLDGVVHYVVQNPDGVWLYCDIEVMYDWLTQEGKNTVPDDTPITCVKCLAGGHEG